MLPAPGRYRLTQVTPPVSGGHICDVRVTPTGLWAGPWFWIYVASLDMFTGAPGMSCECTGEGTYNATGTSGPVTGTCLYLGP